MLKLSCNVSDAFPEVLKLSSEVSEYEPLVLGPLAFTAGHSIVVDSYFFGYVTSSTLNILRYNVVGGAGCPLVDPGLTSPGFSA